MKNNILITGAAGFIGSHVVRLFVKKYSEYNIFSLDNLSYASNLNNINDVMNLKNHKFIKADICDFDTIIKIFKKYEINKVIHLAAESHVDRSIEDPLTFAKTNVLGTLNLLQAALKVWNNNFLDKLFYHISTDEVFGSLGKKGSFNEKSRYDPHSPYSASKASSDHFVRSFSETYGLPILISNCSNNYGPYQFTEKLIPFSIKNILNNMPLSIYGNGENVRDWLYVEDHANAIDVVFHKGTLNDSYNVGGSNEWRNIDLIRLLIKYVDKSIGRKAGTSEKLIKFVKDRKGHDYRYAIDSSKIKEKLGWRPAMNFEQGLIITVNWYIKNNNY